jgi:hypothetical protein
MSEPGQEAAPVPEGDVGAVDLTPHEAAARLQEELAWAGQALAGQGTDAALDGYVRALGLALQLGPAAVEMALAAVLDGAGCLLGAGDTDGLCALGPAVAGTVAQVQEAGVLPATPAMAAWAAVAGDLGALLGQVGLAQALPVERRGGMWRQAWARAALLDEATGALFGLADWMAKAAATAYDL